MGNDMCNKCDAITKSGTSCRNRAVSGTTKCQAHLCTGQCPICLEEMSRPA